MRRSSVRSVAVLVAAAAVSLIVAPIALIPAPAALAQPGASAGRVVGRAAGRVNLLANPGAQVGAASAHGWDSVTIPGWQILHGLPTVVRYGTPGFPSVSGPGPAGRRGQLFAGGLGGTAVLGQDVPLRKPLGGLLGAGTGYVLSGWLGGTSTSTASVRVRFMSTAGRVLGTAAIGPAGGAGRDPRLAGRALRGVLPPGTVRAEVHLVLSTSAKGEDGPDGPRVGYDWAVADGLRLSVLAAVRRLRRSGRPPHACRATSTSSCSTSRTRTSAR